MWETSERLLRMLSLLQRRREWNAEQLASELAVTPRTVRRDVARLRDLGYPIATVHGTGGGYELEAGATLPPLMFDTEEAVATLLALRDSAANGADGASDSALSALDKLIRVMPAQLRPAVQAVSAHSSNVDLGNIIGASAEPVDVTILVLLARACRDRRQLTCAYSSHHGEPMPRRLEPLHLVRTTGRWYLVAYCLDAADWRTFRVDRLTDATVTRTPSYPREAPATDLHEYVAAQIGSVLQRVKATVRVHAPRAAIAHWIMPAWGTVTEESPGTCIVEAGADSYDAMARWLLLLNAHLTVIRPLALHAAFAELATQAARISNDRPSR